MKIFGECDGVFGPNRPGLPICQFVSRPPSCARGVSCRDSAVNGTFNSSQPPDADISENSSTADEPPIIRIIIFLITSHHTLLYIPSLRHRLSVWFQHAFNNSSATDLSLPLTHLINTVPPPSSSPTGKSSPLLTAAKHSKGHLDKAMRYILNNNSTPDKFTHPI